VAPTLCVELFTTADMPDGQPLPPVDHDDIVWVVAHRAGGTTLWRKIFLSSAAGWRAASGASSKERRQTTE
jgi:hypothetical protein